MESGTNNKIKVVWLCHFANSELKDYFNTPEVKELAHWITLFLEIFKTRNNIELHIVAPNLYINIDESFQKDNVFYHLFSYRSNYFPKKLKTLSKILFGESYFIQKLKIRRIILGINPNIIHLFGAENPYYSAGIIQFLNKYPVFITIQGFMRNSSIKNKIVKKKIKIEEKILRNGKNYGTCTKDMVSLIKGLNKSAEIFPHDYPKSVKYIKNDNINSTFDIIFFARVCRDKGIEDLLKAVSIIKKEKPDISLHIIGRVGKTYLTKLLDLIETYDIVENVKLLGFFKSQNDTHKYALNAKLCVLPTYHDTIPGTILESMFMRLPVISYAVGGIPELNEKGEAVALVEKFNIEELAGTIMALLKDEKKRQEMAEYSCKLVKERYADDKIFEDIMKAYITILHENKVKV